MNEKQILKKLTSLGLTETDATIYLFLAREGPQKGRNIAENLNIYKQQLYRSLKRLQNKGLIHSTLEHPAHFSTTSIEKVLDLLIQAKKEQASTLQDSKRELLSNWKSIVKQESAEN